MENLFNGYLSTTSTDGLYTNNTDSAIKVNIYLCNSDTSGIATTISIGNASAASKAVSYPIYKATLAAGGMQLIENVVLNDSQRIWGYATTGSKVVCKIDNLS